MTKKVIYKKYSELTEQEKEEYQFSFAEFLIIVTFVIAGTALGAIFDNLEIFGFLPEGLVRALAGTADTLGFALIGLYVAWNLRSANKETVSINFLGWKRVFTRESKNDYRDWVIGGFLGLAIAIALQSVVFSFAPDPHGLIGVVYAFGYSNMDNFMAGLSVLIGMLRMHGRVGVKAYITHPFYVGNIIMVIGIPIVSAAIRASTGFRPDLNIQSGVESGLMDVDTIGAFVIFLIATRILQFGVPKVVDDEDPTSA